MADEKRQTGFNPATVSALLRGDYANAHIAATPGGIEAQEAAAQRELPAGTKLPKRGTILPGNAQRDGETNRERLESLGFTFGEDLDALFVECSLPAGWQIKPTDHSMWSDLCDRGGRVRGKIFYKGAFYDRRVDMWMEQRFQVVTWYAATPDLPENYDNLEAARCKLVKDHDGRVLQSSPSYCPPSARSADGVDAETQAAAAMGDWLTAHYPDYKDPFAYWDEA